MFNGRGLVGAEVAIMVVGLMQLIDIGGRRQEIHEHCGNSDVAAAVIGFPIF